MHVLRCSRYVLPPLLARAALCGCLAASACRGGGEEEGGGAEVSQAPARAPGAGGKGLQAREAAGVAAPRVEELTRSRPLMGTIVRFTVVDAPRARAEAAVRSALDEMERLESVLSEWLPDSEISRINAAAGKHPVRVGPDTIAVVRAALDVARWSHGAFDPTWAAMRGLYDFRPGHFRVPPHALIHRRRALVDWRQVVLDEEAGTVFLKRAGMALGTGGIAKGYALDRAAAILRAAGIRHYMLYGGGQVQVGGLKHGRPWRVGIQHPRRADAFFGFFEVTDRSISTSGDYERFYVDARGRRWHHILDPRTGEPARGAMSVTVLAPTGLYADALSTAAFVLGPERALRMFRKMPYEADFVMVDGNCRLVATDGAHDRLKMSTELLEGERLPDCSP